MQKNPEVHAMVMGGLERIPENLELAAEESKKNSLEQSIQSLLARWRDFQGQLDLTQNDFRECFYELDSREKKLNSEKESLELTRELVELRFKEVGDRERDFDLFRQKKIRDLELREEKLVRIRENYVKEVDEQLGEQDRKAGDLLAALKSEKLQMEDFKHVLEKTLEEIGLKENSLEDKRKEIELIQIVIEKRTRELEHNEEKVKERERKVELKEEEVNLWKERQSDIKSKERQLQLMIEDLEFQEQKCDFFRKLNENQMKELELREKQLEKNFKQEFALNEKGFGFGQELLEKGLKDLELKREAFEQQIKEFEFRKKELEESLEEFHSKNKYFLSEKKLFDNESKTLKDKKTELEDRIKQFELREKELVESFKELHLKKEESLSAAKLLEEESKDLESKWREFEQRIEKFSVREKELEESFQKFHKKEKQLELEKKMLEKESTHLESRRKDLEESIKKFELRKKELELKETQFMGKMLLEEESKHSESKGKGLDKSIKRLELREKDHEIRGNQLDSVSHGHLESKPVQDTVKQSLLCNSTDLDITSIVMMDGKDLQIFLNEHQKDHLLISDKVFKALHLSKDPAELVFNAMEGFFPPHLRKGSKEFSGYVVRKSCILLLQQLTRISPQIQSCVRDKALKLAREWKTKLTTGSTLEVYAFLYLLASYDLASAFDAEDILRYLEFATKHQRKLEPELCRRLGLKEKIPSLVQKLLKCNLSLEAIKFIYGFGLVGRFPPVPILRNHLKHVKIYASSMVRKRFSTKNVQNDSIDTRVDAVRSVIRCIVDHKLESQYSPKNLENTIKQLLRQKEHKTCTGSSTCHKPLGKQRVEEVKQISSTAPPSQPKAQRPATDLSNISTGLSHALALIIANMDGKNLLSFLSSHVIEHELLHNEVLSALRISDNPAKLVLGAVLCLSDSHQTEEELKSCIFLLEQFVGLSPDIGPDVKEAAQYIALDWQAKLKAENRNSFSILMFLLLVRAYRLGSKFQSDELLNLYQTVADQKPSPELSHALGISNAAALHSKVETQPAASESLEINNLATSSSMVHELDGQSLCINTESEGKERVSVCSEVPTFIYHSTDPADLILDALRNCHRSNFSKSKNPQLVNSFCHLLEQLMSVSLDIKPSVRVRAYEFALEWKANIIGPCSWEALGFLQLVASYQLSSFFSCDELFGLFEVVCQPREAANLIRILGLVDNVQGFISQLIKKRKLHLAFAYIYDFKLVHMFPPVTLLKQHVLSSKIVAKKICNKGKRTPEAQEKAIASEISALKGVIKLIMQHRLQSEYSPDKLRSRIEELETQMASLKASMQKVDANKETSPAPEGQKQQHSKKRPAYDAISINEYHLQPPKKFPRLVSPSQIADHQSIQSEPGSSQLPGNSKAERHAPSLRAPPRNYSLSGSPLIIPPQNQFFPPSPNAVADNYIRPLMAIAGQPTSYPVWCHPDHPNFQRMD